MMLGYWLNGGGDQKCFRMGLTNLKNLKFEIKPFQINRL